MRFATAVLPTRLQKCFRMIHLWPVVELMCQSPSSQWREKRRPECLLNCVVMRSGHGWGAWLKVIRPRLDRVLLAKQKQAKHIFTKSSQRSQFSSVQSLSQVWLFATPWNEAHQAYLSITNSWSLLKLMSIEWVMPSNHLILSSPSPPTYNLPQHQGLFKWVSSSYQVAKVLEFQLQHQSFQWTPRTDLLQDGLVGSPCSPRDSQESSPTPQFKSINSSVLSFLHSPTLTSTRDHWKSHSFD